MTLDSNVDKNERKAEIAANTQQIRQLSSDERTLGRFETLTSYIA